MSDAPCPTTRSPCAIVLTEREFWAVEYALQHLADARASSIYNPDLGAHDRIMAIYRQVHEQLKAVTDRRIACTGKGQRS